MPRWDDLPHDVQEVLSAFVRRNLEAELAEEAIRLPSLVKETEAKLLTFQRNRAMRSSIQWAKNFQQRDKFPDAELPRVEAEIRASEQERVRKLKESLFGGVTDREFRREVCETVDVYVDRCTALGIKHEFTRPYITPDHLL
jgi:hypothetical protein